MVSGDRQVAGLDHMPPSKKFGNRMGSYLLRSVAGSQVHDASSGFRAFSRECALRLNPYIGHTYTHQTLIQALHNGMVIKEVPITFRRAARTGGQSRLISGVSGHIMKSLGTILRTMVTYRPLSVLGGLGVLFLVAGGLVGLLPLVAWIEQGNTEGHLQSLIASIVLILMGIQFAIFGLIADTISANRRMTEEVLYRLKHGTRKESAILPPLEEPLDNASSLTDVRVPAGRGASSPADRAAPLSKR